LGEHEPAEQALAEPVRRAPTQPSPSGRTVTNSIVSSTIAPIDLRFGHRRE
jgi:hypothetical protein